MIKEIVFWSVFLGLIEIYSVGVTVFAKRHGHKLWALNLLPLASFFYVGRYLKEFKILSVPVKKWGALAVELTVAILVFSLFRVWGRTILDAYQRDAIEKIAILPIAACCAVLYFGTVKSTLDILFKHYANFRCDWLVCALILPSPFLLALRCVKEIDIYEVKKTKQPVPAQEQGDVL